MKSQRLTVALAALTLLALGVRAAAAAQVYLISPDGTVYAGMAKALAAGEWAAGLAPAYHPLLPFLGGLLIKLGLGAEVALRSVSVVLGTLAVPLVVALGRRVHSWQAGLAAGFLWAVHPYAVRTSAQVMAEATYACAFLAALWLTLRSREGHAGWAGLGGFCVGLAYLARPEGLLLGLPLGLLLLSGPRRWSKAGLFAMGLLALVGPYAGYLSGEAGHPVLTRKKAPVELVTPPHSEQVRARTEGKPAPRTDIQQLIRALSTGRVTTDKETNWPYPPVTDRPVPPPGPVEPSPPEGLAQTGWDVVRLTAEVFSLFLIPLLLLGWVGTASVSRRWLLLIWILYGLLYLLVRDRIGYLSRRHLLTQAALLMPWAGVGLWRLQVGLTARAAWLGKTTPWVLPVLLLPLFLPRALAPQEDHKVLFRSVGEWLMATEGPVLGREASRVAWYAGVGFVPLVDGPIDRVLAQADRHQAGTLVVYLRTRQQLGNALPAALRHHRLQPWFRVESEEESRRYQWLVYRIGPP